MADKHDVTEDSLYVVSRGRGRPPAEEPSTSLSTWIPTQHYDRLAKHANRQGVSMSALVRDMIILQLHRK